jgi:hypothetical protein
MNVLKNLYTAASTALICILLSACATASKGSHSGTSATSKNSSLEAIIDAQLAAYNRRDVEGFLSYYSDDAKIFDYPNRLTETGKDQLRKRYRQSFSNKDIRAVILKRIVFGRFVIDHERITGRPDGPVEAIATYEIKDGKIIVVTFIKP